MHAPKIDTHPLSETHRKGDKLNLKERCKQRETEGGREKKDKTDKEVCALLNQRDGRLYLCDGSEVAEEIQTPNITDKNAG